MKKLIKWAKLDWPARVTYKNDYQGEFGVHSYEIYSDIRKPKEWRPWYEQEGKSIRLQTCRSLAAAKAVCEQDLRANRLTVGELIALDEPKAKSNPRLIDWTRLSGVEIIGKAKTGQLWLIRRENEWQLYYTNEDFNIGHSIAHATTPEPLMIRARAETIEDMSAGELIAYGVEPAPKHRLARLSRENPKKLLNWTFHPKWQTGLSSDIWKAVCASHMYTIRKWSDAMGHVYYSPAARTGNRSDYLGLGETTLEKAMHLCEVDLKSRLTAGELIALDVKENPKKLLKWKQVDHPGRLPRFTASRFGHEYTILRLRPLRNDDSPPTDLPPSYCYVPYYRDMMQGKLILDYTLAAAKQICEEHLRKQLTTGELMSLDVKENPKKSKKLIEWRRPAKAINDQTYQDAKKFNVSRDARSFFFRVSSYKEKSRTYYEFYAAIGGKVSMRVRDLISRKAAQDVAEEHLRSQLTVGELIALDES